MSTKTPSGVVIVTGVLANALSCARVSVVVPTAREARPAAAAMVKEPGVALAVSASVVSVVLEPPSVSGMEMTGVPSVCPLMVMTN